MKKPKYPKIKREQKLNCKLNDTQIKEIKKLHQSGVSQREIARKFDIARVTVKYWVDEEYRARDKKRVMDKIALRRSTEEGKNEINRKRADEIYKARHTIPELQIYHQKELDILNENND